MGVALGSAYRDSGLGLPWFLEERLQESRRKPAEVADHKTERDPVFAGSLPALPTAFLKAGGSAALRAEMLPTAELQGISGLPSAPDI